MSRNKLYEKVLESRELEESMSKNKIYYKKFAAIGGTVVAGTIGLHLLVNGVVNTIANLIPSDFQAEFVSNLSSTGALALTTTGVYLAGLTYFWAKKKIQTIQFEEIGKVITHLNEEKVLKSFEQNDNTREIMGEISSTLKYRR